MRFPSGMGPGQVAEKPPKWLKLGIPHQVIDVKLFAPG